MNKKGAAWRLFYSFTLWAMHCIQRKIARLYFYLILQTERKMFIHSDILGFQRLKIASLSCSVKVMQKCIH